MPFDYGTKRINFWDRCVHATCIQIKLFSRCHGIEIEDLGGHKCDSFSNEEPYCYIVGILVFCLTKCFPPGFVMKLNISRNSYYLFHTNYSPEPSKLPAWGWLNQVPSSTQAFSLSTPKSVQSNFLFGCQLLKLYQYYDQVLNIEWLNN